MPLYTIVNDSNYWVLVEGRHYARQIYSKDEADNRRTMPHYGDEIWNPSEMRSVVCTEGASGLPQAYAINYGYLKILLINGMPCLSQPFWPQYSTDERWREQHGHLQRLYADIDEINAPVGTGVLLYLQSRIQDYVAGFVKESIDAARVSMAAGGVRVRCEFSHQDQHWVITDMQVTRVPAPGETVRIEKGFTLQIVKDGVHHVAGNNTAVVWAQVIEDEINLSEVIKTGNAVSYGDSHWDEGPLMMRVDDETKPVTVWGRVRNLGPER